MQAGAATVGSVEAPQNIKGRTRIYPTSGIYLKETKARTQKHACVPMCIVALFTEAKTQQQPECPSTVNKESTTHTHKYYSAINEKGILPSATTGRTFRALR